MTPILYILGSHGIYTATSEDYALSLIAERFAMTTKEVVALNPWLFDKGRVKFNYPTKVLVAEGTPIIDDTEHLYVNEESADFFHDANGGFDTYYAGNQDIILDSDGKGIVSFEGSRLSGGKLIKGTSNTYKGDGGVYTLDGGTLTFNKGGKTLTIEQYLKDEKDLNIKLTGKEEDDDEPKDDDPKDYPKDEDFSSPLVLDLNGNGITSEFIYDTNTHFDMDGDTLKERTAWIEAEDGLLTLDKNQDGVVNNGTGLFGNYTKLQDGRDATDGFNALSDYDTNNDGKIDEKDNVYKALKVWQDANQDGQTDVGELKTLLELNISSINLEEEKILNYSQEVLDTKPVNNLSYRFSLLRVEI